MPWETLPKTLPSGGQQMRGRENCVLKLFAILKAGLELCGQERGVRMVHEQHVHFEEASQLDLSLVGEPQVTVYW